jgi:glutamate carboxypeptidase
VNRPASATSCLTTLMLLTCAASMSIRAQALSNDEQQIATHAHTHTEEAIGLLQRIVDIDSPTEDIEGVREVGAVLADEFEALGMTTRWVDLPPEMKRAGHLVAETRGTRGKRLLLLGHIDTVLRGERFRREGNKGYGTGTSDMKSGVVVIVYALKALHAAGALQDARIAVMLTGDEEDAGIPFDVSRAEMVSLAQASDAVLSFEASIGDTATVGRRGVRAWTLDVTGVTGHSSGIFGDELGSGAVYEAARILAEFHDALRGERYLTVNPSVIVGGTQATLDDYSGTAVGKSNVVAPQAHVLGDLRYISARQDEKTRARMERIVARSLPQTSARIEFQEGYPAMTPTKDNYALLEALSDVSDELGYGPVEALDPGDRGAGDIGFVAHLKPSLDGIGGAAGDHSHAPGEWTDLEPLPRLIGRAAVLMYRLTR